jgi:hypothetical protein
MSAMLSSDAMPRTTVDFDPSVLAELRRRAAIERKSIGKMASELLAQQMAAGTPPPDCSPLEWISRDLGVPRVDLEDEEALGAALDARS